MLRLQFLLQEYESRREETVLDLMFRSQMARLDKVRGDMAASFEYKELVKKLWMDFWRRKLWLANTEPESIEDIAKAGKTAWEKAFGAMDSPETQQAIANTLRRLRNGRV